jgi:hypothetical protein
MFTIYFYLTSCYTQCCAGRMYMFGPLFTVCTNAWCLTEHYETKYLCNYALE